MTRWAVVLMVALAAAWPQDRKPQMYRATTHAVAVDVAVFDGDRVVSSLGAADFEVLDNGVRQTISAVDYNVLPIDLKLVFDVSGSITEADLAQYLRAMQQVTAALDPRDRCEIMTFNTRIAGVAARQSPPVTIALQRGGPDGTAFFDAVALAMVTVPAVDRRQITVVMSDAQDNTSFFDEAAMLEAARRTDAVVYTILPAGPGANAAPGIARLQSLSILTGGRLVRTPHQSLIGPAVLGAIEEFRHSYVLRYMLAGVALDGWHKLTVSVRRHGGLTVRARNGYFGR